MLSPRDDPRHGHYRANELAVLVEEANAARRWVMAAPMGVLEAAERGIAVLAYAIERQGWNKWSPAE